MPTFLGMLSPTLLITALALIPPGLAAGAAQTTDQVLTRDMCGPYFLVQLARTGESDPVLHLLLDTGANHTVVDPDSVQRFAGKSIKSGDWVRFRRLEAGPVTFRDLRGRARNLDHISRALGRSIDGILGYPAFAHLLLTLDYPAGEVRVRKGRLKAQDPHVLPLTDRHDRRPWLDLEVAGRRRPLLMDSGSGNGLVLHRSNRYHWLVRPLPVRSSMRINRLELREVGRLEAGIPFAGSLIVNPMVELTSHTPLLGTAILKSFSLTFDQKRQLVRVKQYREGPIATGPIRGTGLVYNPVHAGLEVVRVLHDSPADRAGLRKGDVVTAVDGRPVHQRDCGSFGRRFQSGETRTQLSVQRGGASLEFSSEVVNLVP